MRRAEKGKTQIHKDAKQNQTPEFPSNLRISKFYDLVGKGPMKFSENFLEVYGRFKSHEDR